MQLFRSKGFYMFLGLVLGFILGLFFYDYLLTPEDTSPKTVETAGQPAISEVKKDSSVARPSKNQPVMDAHRQKHPANKHEIEPERPQQQPQKDTLTTTDTIKTQPKAEPEQQATDSSQEFYDDRLMVAKEEMLAVKRILPRGTPPEYFCSPNRQRDSALVDNNFKPLSDTIMVEFWISPVNFRGYRLSKRLLILYGVEDWDSVQLEFRPGDDYLWMIYKGKSFRLPCSSDYVPLNFNKEKKEEIPHEN